MMLYELYIHGSFSSFFFNIIAAHVPLGSGGNRVRTIVPFTSACLASNSSLFLAHSNSRPTNAFTLVTPDTADSCLDTATSGIILVEEEEVPVAILKIVLASFVGVLRVKESLPAAHTVRDGRTRTEYVERTVPYVSI
jgi:hypothetical protein